ncbi:MAG TPA: sialidase family protein [Candidatus Thermoplasmatota archaeon]|nr:sialidase family protein [Candidatus Thermoplasmatota archaeon]
MRIAPLALLAMLSVAGCFGSDPTPAIPSEAPAVVVPPFAMAESVIAGNDGGSEPSLGVTPAGHLFTDLGSDVYRSTDGGHNWTLMGNPSAPVPNLDPDLAVDVDGNVWESRLWLGCAAVAVSRDDGETWSSNPAVCPLAGGDRQYVVPTTGGEAYLYFHQLPSFHQTATKTTDYGRTWLPTGPVEFPDHVLFANGGSGWGGGGFWNQPTGSVFFTFSYNHEQGGDQLSGTNGAGYSVTRDGGLTWTARKAADLDGRQLGLGLVTGAADDAGNVYLTWGEALGDASDDLAIFVAASRDDGETWGDKVRVHSGTGSKVFPVIVAGEAGKVAVAYYEGSEAAFPDDMQGTWNVTLASTSDFFGNATFVHGQLTSTPVKEGPICISGTTCTGDREFADYFDAVRMPDGRVGVTYNFLVDGDGALRNGFAMTSQPLLGPKPTAA